MPANGFNVWDMPFQTIVNAGYVSLGVDTANQAAFAFGSAGADSFSVNSPAEIYRFDFFGGVTPSAPSNVLFNVSPSGYPTNSAFDQVGVFCLDALNNIWVYNEFGGGTLLQSYSAISGSQISSTSVYGAGGGFAYPVADIVPFVWNGIAHIGVWFKQFNQALASDDAAILQVYDVSSGSPSPVGAVTIPINPIIVDFTQWMDTALFFDGFHLYAFRVDVDPATAYPTGGTLFQISLSGFTVASASFAGAYSFTGNMSDGHIYLLNINGSVSDIDSTLTLVANYPGLAGAGFDVGFSPFVGGSSQFRTPYVVYAMKNSQFGTSIDVNTDQFFINSATIETLRSNFERIQVFLPIDDLGIPADWGVTTTAHVPMWIPFRQSMLVPCFTGGDPLPWKIYEFIYTPLTLPNPCTGVTTEFR